MFDFDALHNAEQRWHGTRGVEWESPQSRQQLGGGLVFEDASTADTQLETGVSKLEAHRDEAAPHRPSNSSSPADPCAGRTVRELRQIIQAAELRHDDCLERVDIQARAREAVEKLEVSGRLSAQDPDARPPQAGKPSSSAIGKGGLHRQFWVSPAGRVPVRREPKDIAEPIAVQKPGAIIVTTGRVIGPWVEVRISIFRTGWMFASSLLPCDDGGRHGDDLEKFGGADYVFTIHCHAMLRLDLPPILVANSADCAKATSLSVRELRAVIEAVGRSHTDCTERAELETRALQALAFPRFRPGKYLVERSGHRAHLWAPRERLHSELPMPLLLVLHGAAKGRLWDFETFNTGWHKAADSCDVLVVVPEAYNHTWDFILSSQREDLDFVQFAVAEACRLHNVDDRRIAVMGMSDGGSMGLSVALCNPHVFQAGLIQAAGFLAYEPRLIPSGMPKPHIFLEYGTQDELFDYHRVALPMRERLRSAGLSVDFRGVQGATHAVRKEFFQDALSFWLALPPRPVVEEILAYK